MKKFILLLMVLILSLPSFAATRFYLPSAGAPEITPAYDATWNYTTDADRVRLARFKTNSAMNDTKATAGSGVDSTSALNRQYISDPIAPQTITGTVQGQVRGLEGGVNDNRVSAVLIRVVSNDGTVVRGTLLNLTYPALTAANEYTLTMENRYTPVSTAVNSVTAQSGDRIVIEIGAFIYKKNGNSTQGFGDSAVADLPIDQTTVTQSNPWIEFSQDIMFPGVTVIE
ncbi:hypothetical protein ACFLZ2_01125 [Candidatus Margulisiibacteriota bacterium]